MEEMSFNGCSVIFHNVLEWYEPGKAILCEFSMKDDALRESKQENDCYVGVFHVGWDSLAANITRKNYSLIEAISDKLFHVDFQGNELPDANPDEFYQFCFYNIKSEVVYGASCPFQICERGDAIEPFVVCTENSFLSPQKFGTKESMNNDWMKENIEIADDEDEEFGTVMVVKKSAHMEESLSKFQKENEILLKQTETMKSESEKSAVEVNRILQESNSKDQHIKILEERINESQKVINHLNNRIKEIKNELEIEHEAKIKELAFEKENLESSRAKAHFVEINLLKSEFKEKENKLFNEVKALKNALDIEKNSCKLLEEEHRNILHKFGEIKDAHGKEVEETKQMEAKLVETISLLKVEKQKNVGLLNEMDNLHEAVELTKAELGSKIKEFATKEDLLLQDIDSLKEQLEKAQKECNTLFATVNDLKEKEHDFDNVYVEMKTKNTELELELQEICQVKSMEIEKLTMRNETQADLIIESSKQIETLELKLNEKDEEMMKMKYGADCKEEEAKHFMEELKLKIEQLQTQIEIQKEPRPVSMTKSEGSYYALQVAYSFIQKQLKQFKTENEELRKMVKTGNSQTDKSVIKEIEDLKLRLQFGKQAFESQFKECEKVKNELKTIKRSISTGRGDTNELSMKRENEKLQSEVVSLQTKMVQKESIEKDMWVKMEEANDKMKQYEDNIKLVRDENKLLRSQVSALLEGATTSATIRRNFDPDLGDVIYHPPSSKKQEIAYPPSMNKIDRPNSAWLPPAQVKRNNPPANQVIPNRQSNAPPASLTLRGRGKYPKGEQHTPSFQCPVCQFDFPVGYSEASASAHVNNHFRE